VKEDHSRTKIKKKKKCSSLFFEFQRNNWKTEISIFPYFHILANFFWGVDMINLMVKIWDEKNRNYFGSGSKKKLNYVDKGS